MARRPTRPLPAPPDPPATLAVLGEPRPPIDLDLLPPELQESLARWLLGCLVERWERERALERPATTAADD